MIDRWHTALHEAGHAVAHERLDVLQGDLTIKKSGHNLGASTAEGKEHVWNAEEAKNQVLCYCAGYAALIATGKPESEAVLGADDDFEHAVELLQSWLPHEKLEEWKSQSTALMSKPENIAAVDSVAKALMKYETLVPDYYEMLIEKADGNISEEEWQQFLAFRFPEMLTEESE